jgi:lipoprotein-releasing system permease protein
MKWYAYLAWKQLFPTGKRFSFFSAMSIAGVVIGVMVLFVVQSVMEGFQRNIRETIVRTQGDVRIDSPHVIYEGDELDAFLQNLPEVEATAKYAHGVAMLQYDNRPVFPAIKGIDLENESRVMAVEKFIKQGSLDNFYSGSIILGGELARRIGATVGDCVEVYSPLMLENIGDSEIILPRTLEVVAIHETGYHHADRDVAMVTLDTMQDLYGLDGGIHGILLKLKPRVRPEKFTFELNKHLTSPIVATGWQEMNRDFLFALKTEKTMMLFVLVFILLIAAFSMAGSLTITVIRKTREIGLIGALGGTAWQCAVCFMLQGMIIGTLGGLGGVGLGMVVLRFRNGIVSIFAKLCGIEDFMLRFYSFANMPAEYGAGDVFSMIILAIVACCLAGILPAIKVARINPAEALRNE